MQRAILTAVILLSLNLTLAVSVNAQTLDCADRVISGLGVATLEAQTSARECMSGLKFSTLTPDNMLQQVQNQLGHPPNKTTRVADHMGGYGQWFVFYVVDYDDESVWYVLTVVDNKVVNVE